MKSLKTTSPLLLLILLLWNVSGNAQTPQWDWARGVGSNGQDNTSSSMHVDSAGNQYEVISISGRTITLAGHVFTNPNPQIPTGGGGSISIFVKYDPQGNAVWAEQFPSSFYPNTMYTDRHGYSYMECLFQDSLSLWGYTIRDTAEHHGFCIVRIDPAGHVVSVHVKNSRPGSSQIYTGILSMQPWDESHILILAQQGNGTVNIGQKDTIDGIALPLGSFLALMDTGATISHVRYLGSDTISYPYTQNGGIVYILNHGPITNLYTYGSDVVKSNSRKTVYMQFPYGVRTVFDTSIHLTGPPADIYNSHKILMKLDSNLNFQWGTVSAGGAEFASDADDNVYLGTTAGTQIGDTVRYGNLFTTFPINLRSPNGYFCVIKIDGSGVPLWIDTFMDLGGGGNEQALFTDPINNVYLCGIYGSRLYAGPYTLSDPNNMFIMKIGGDGQVIWATGTANAGNKLGAGNNYGIDENGNIYTNGTYFYTGQPGFGIGDPIFGHDSLIGVTPINGFPVAPDVFTARLGYCHPASPVLSASGPLIWCGADSVRLTVSTAYGHLWSNGDTTNSIVIKNSGYVDVYATDTLGCYARSAVQNIRANPNPHLTIDSIYDGAAAMASGATTPYTYLWSNAAVTDSIIHVTSGWYIVTVTDSNGCRAMDSIYITGPSGIEDIKSGVLVNVYPNPAANMLNIECSVSGIISIYNILGEEVIYQSVKEGKNELNVSALANGVYQIKIISKENAVYHQNLTIRH